MFGPCFVMWNLVFFNHFDGEEIAGCYTLIVFLVSCDCLSSVALPRGAVGCSAIY